MEFVENKDFVNKKKVFSYIKSTAVISWIVDEIFFLINDFRPFLSFMCFAINTYSNKF